MKIAFIIMVLPLTGCGDSDLYKEQREMAYTVGWVCRDKGISLAECKEDYYRIARGEHVKSFRKDRP
jgi:hypothetical protein